MFHLKRFSGTKLFRKCIWFHLKRFLGTKLIYMMHLVLPKTFTCAPNRYTGHREVINGDGESWCKRSLLLHGFFRMLLRRIWTPAGRRSRRRPSASLHPSSGRCPPAPPIYGIMGDYGSPPGPSTASCRVTKKTGARLAPVFLRLVSTFGTEALQEVLDLVELVTFRDLNWRDVRVIQTESLVT